MLFAAIELGIFEALAKDNGATSAALAKQLNLNAATLERLLDALVGLKLLSRQLKSGLQSRTVALYSLTPITAAYLLRSSPHSMCGYAVHSNRVIWPLFGNLEASVRTGKHSWEESFGAGQDRSAALLVPVLHLADKLLLVHFRQEIFDKVYKTEADRNQFMEGQR